MEHTSQLGELLDTIKRDGIQEAERRASQIVAAAEKSAAEIVEQAQKSAEKDKREAKQNIARWQQSAERQVQQAAENVIIVVRERIVSLFDRLLADEIKHSVSSEQIGEIICHVVGEQILASRQHQKVRVSGSDAEIASIRTYLHQKLKAQLKDSVSFATQKNNHATITLNFGDEHSGYGLSHNDICHAIAGFLAPQLRVLLSDNNRENEASASGKTKKDSSHNPPKK